MSRRAVEAPVTAHAAWLTGIGERGFEYAETFREEESNTMRAATFRGPGVVEVGDRPDPVIEAPTDAIVRVVLSGVCGSDLWYYRGESPHAVGSIGHEFIGVVEETGADVETVAPGDLVVAPFIFSDMSCSHCLNGSTISCVRGGNFGGGTVDGGQGEALRVPLAGTTLVPVPCSDQLLRPLLALSDVIIVGVPHGEIPFAQTFFRNVGWRGGPAPARPYIPELLDDVLAGAIDPGRVFDHQTDLDHVEDAYTAMDERRAIKSLIQVASV
jgi:threonine dehydrogenase-like Zn-dependent dehydrogenase